MKKNSTLPLCVAAVIAATALSACGNDKTDDGGLSASPINLQVIAHLTSANPSSEAFDGAQAAAAAVNASGGVNGHPLKVTVCDAGNGASVTQAVTCARKLVADKSIVAEVGDFEIAQDQVNTILAAAKVPNIGPPPTGQSVLSSPNSFPLAGSEGAALGITLADAGAKKIHVAYVDSPQAAAVLPFTKSVLAMSRPDASVLSGIPVQISTSDLTPAVTKASSGDGVVLAMIPAQLSSWLTVSKGGDFPQKLVASSTSLLPKELEALGSKADGLLVASGLPFVTGDSEGVVRFRDEMARYAPGKSVDSISLNAWLSTWAFAQVARTMKGDITRETVMAAFGNLTDFNVFGLLPPGFTTTKGSSVPGFSRLFNQSTIEGVVKDGKIVQTSDGYVPVFGRK
ncbi:ABC transporter substrate-binding protein [Actinocorallia longicatena]|uniref:Leucine-binding protein domain-containing protein n=1 Tax=Actinocorallia longicatena TaxID=111803 RepID=A0ABP6QLP4_9ACTN